MRKTALFLAVLISLALPASVSVSALKEPEAVLVFDYMTAPSEGEADDAEKTLLIDSIAENLSYYMTPAPSSPVADFVFGGIKNDSSQKEEVIPEEEQEEINSDKDTDREYDGSLADSELDKGFSASGVINSEKPILQEASGTVIMGYVAPSQYKLTDRERELVERVVMAEVSGKSYVDALAVAQCIYDRCLSYKSDVESVIFAKHAFAEPTYKYEPTQLVKDAVSDIFDKGIRLTKEKLLYFYAVRVASPGAFHETQRCLIVTSKHRYFGPWEQ